MFGLNSPREWREISSKFAPGPVDQDSIREESAKLFDGLVLPGGASGDYTSVMIQIIFTLMWGRVGFPHLVLRPKRAAYFATTQIKPECVDMFEPPWPAFYISLVDSELSTDDSEGNVCPITGLVVWSCRVEPGDEAVRRGLCAVGDRCWSFVALTGSGVCIFRSKYSYNWDSSGTGKDPATWAEAELPTIFGEGQSDRDLRLNLLLAQLIAGVCLEFQTVAGAREAAQRRARSKNNKRTLSRYVNATPQAYVLGEDVVVDARKVVGEYHSNGGRSPTVRSYVRPHPRNQPYGPGRTLTKLIRIEGFWRGPTGAPNPRADAQVQG